MILVIEASVVFYDHMRGHGALEHDARHAAEMYLRRKAPDIDREGAATILADALARRASARILQAHSDVVQEARP